MLKCVDRILLRVPNVAAATKFYTETLGLRLDRKQPSAAALKFDEGDTELILHDDARRGDMEIVFGVDDVVAMFELRDDIDISFISPPTQAGDGYRATIRDPFGNVLVIVDRARDSARQALPVPESAGALFDEVPEEDPAQDRDALIAVYSEIGRTADDLPYTRHFEELYTRYTRTLSDPKPTANEVWRQLLTLRKRKGGLPKLGAAASKPPVLEPEHKAKLKELLGEDIGRRDRLPYTERFDQLVVDFNKQFARPFTPHVVWRIVATLAK
ncbi:MAG: VOC family protein [Burkholderiales bacterium]|nr:VOC family protein [Phycisphaerae bacterium]